MNWLMRLTGRKDSDLLPSPKPEDGTAGPIVPFPVEALRSRLQMNNPLLLPPLTLAYLGDGVYELYVRQRLLERGVIKVNDLHQTAVRYVRAAAQARTLAEIYPLLTADEQEVVRRGRNAKGHAAPKGSDAAEYSAATAFEALLGFLYIAGREDRLGEVLKAAVLQAEQE